ncbi:hypothetical protein ASG35_04355 [Burkholderia sp. Leaf177]|nr:hypothetical protein ASG35_04355 [Burkholderia sp. Leaf177]
MDGRGSDINAAADAEPLKKARRSNGLVVMQILLGSERRLGKFRDGDQGIALAGSLLRRFIAPTYTIGEHLLKALSNVLRYVRKLT